MSSTRILNCCCLENDRCPSSGITVRVEVTEELYTALNESPEQVGLTCDICNGDLKILGEQMLGGYLKINSMPANEKRQALKKRSKEHFKKKLRDQRVDMIRNCDKEFKKL